MNIDLLIQGGTILDGSGAPPRVADVAICDGRIATVGNLPAAAADEILDASQCVVTPGFIDIHSHSDFTLVVDPRAVSSITQGVTLEVVGNCGHGCAPLGDPELARSNIYGCRSDHEIPWRSVAEYLDTLQRQTPAVNVVTLVPNGNLRLATAGLVDRPATSGELAQMKRMLSRALEEGAWGFSTGLEYGPERGCSEAEIVQLCKLTARAGGIYATHTRNRTGEAQETIAEAIRTATAADVPLQISHISVVARLIDDGRRAVQQAIEQVAAARRSGLDVGFDMHTRLFGTTHLSAALPPWALQGDKTQIANRLRSHSTRREMKAYESIVTALAGNDWSRILVFHCAAQPDWSRRSIAEIAEQRGGDPFDAIYDLLLAEVDRLHEVMVLALTYREPDLRLAFEQPDCMIGSDATALAPDGPLSGTSFHGAYTWAGWFYRHFVRDQQMITPQEAVRRLTSLPAERLGLRDRGTIRETARADLAIFEPELFAECGTLFEPNQIATGMRHVVVNGVITLRDGEMTGHRGGQVLRR
ncbi:MAG: amidohydrolase family protein [Planctomycetota bacterium]|nr:amidohydrolase family protein [Planctomycetota bacterium]